MMDSWNTHGKTQTIIQLKDPSSLHTRGGQIFFFFTITIFVATLCFHSCNKKYIARTAKIK